ncbi:MAG: hypothetical protein H6840_09930 [Planctomycetes bacterium]|nr:hypothetical protein [Planctomycetota bacterium]
MTDFRRVLSVLAESGIEFIVVGGVAAAAHGSPRATFDLDVVYRRTPQNLARLVAALGPLHPSLRGAPPGLPFNFDVQTLKAGLNFTLCTDFGLLVLIGDIAGGGDYDALLPHSTLQAVHGASCRFVDLDTLIHLKRTAGRPKDFEAIAELELLRDATDRQQ